MHRLEHAHVNCYLLEEGGKLTLIDAGLPDSHRFILAAIHALGHRPEDVEALVLTHAHFDHIGAAKRLHRDIGCPVHVHPDDAYIARHPYRYAHERSRLLYPAMYPRAVPVLAGMAAAGALWVRGISDVVPYEGTGTLDVPGRPVVVETPGHTFGHCALNLPNADAVITGDALVTLDPYTGAEGPRIVAGAATANSEQALSSLGRLDATGARIVLPGHGAPFTGGIHSAVAIARTTGAS
ncbi:MBL fold metallo-hydrolase [Herbiconiux oxytropis]|uniref:MBL fold metallo-hydrolase n=1 Tax=Herbiconiux oxytropis TaxID=2970915 RepID=UPI0028775F49|nr:MBL fold metallo-hydrolase [Herbiconiux oxytropis]